MVVCFTEWWQGADLYNIPRFWPSQRVHSDYVPLAVLLTVFETLEEEQLREFRKAGDSVSVC